MDSTYAPLSHLNRSKSLNNLANALRTRFEQSGRHDDLKEASLLHKDAFGLQTNPYPSRFWSLTNLAVDKWRGFDQSSRLEDHEEATVLFLDTLGL